MPKVIFTTQLTVEMDELNVSDIKEMGYQVATAAKNDIQGVVQSVEVTGSSALPVAETIDCMPAEETLQV